MTTPEAAAAELLADSVRSVDVMIAAIERKRFECDATLAQLRGRRAELLARARDAGLALLAEVAP